LTDLDSRLTRCFAGAFPDLRETQIPSATVDNTASWDSMGALTLAALIEEEFGVTFGDDVIGSLRSYAAVRAELAKSIPDAAVQVSGR
jgi:acyl carrier protein